MIFRNFFIFMLVVFPAFSTLRGQNKTAQATNSTARILRKFNGETYCPGFLFTDTAGRKVTLEQFRGRNVLINLWFIGCMPCMDEIPFEKALYQRFRNDTSFTFLNICVRQQSFEHWRSFTSHFQMAGEQLMVDGQVLDSLGGDRLSKMLRASSFPTYILLDANGKIRGYSLPEPSSEIELDYILDHLNTGRSVADLYKEFTNKMLHFNSNDNSADLNQWIRAFYKMEPMEYFLQHSK